MRSMNLLDKLEFRSDLPNSQPLYVSPGGRIIRFALKPGQRIPEHRAPDAQLYIVVVKGRGLFAGGDGTKREFGPDSLLVFDPGESHAIEALDEELVFIAMLHRVASADPDRTGGPLSRESS